MRFRITKFNSSNVKMEGMVGNLLMPVPMLFTGGWDKAVYYVIIRINK